MFVFSSNRSLQRISARGVVGIAPPINVGRMVVVETCVSTLINAFIPAAIIWCLGIAPPKRLIGHDNILPGIIAATILPIFCMTVALTSILRRRLASKRASTPEKTLKRGFALLAVPLLPRAAGLTMLGLLVLAPAALGFVYAQALLPMTPYRFALFNVSYGALIGITITPLIVLATLAEKQVLTRTNS